MSTWEQTRAALARLDAASDACDRALDEAEALAAITEFYAAESALMAAYAADTADYNPPHQFERMRLTPELEKQLRRWSGYVREEGAA